METPLPSSAGWAQRDRTVLQARGQTFRVGETADLVSGFPLRVRCGEFWEVASFALDRPCQVHGGQAAPWAEVSDLRLEEIDGLFVLTGTAQPAGRSFELTADDPLGRWSALHWLDQTRLVTSPACRPVLTCQERAALTDRRDFSARPSSEGWVGSRWFNAAWSWDPTAAVLRPIPASNQTPFLGLLVQHADFCISTQVLVPTTGRVGVGLEVRLGTRTVRAELKSGRGTPTTILAGHLQTLPNSRQSASAVMTLQLIATASTFEWEVFDGEHRVARYRSDRPRAAVLAGGFFVDADPTVGFKWFEYRGGRVAVDNRPLR